MEPPIPTATYEGSLSPGSNSTSWAENKATLLLPAYHDTKDTVAVSLLGDVVNFNDPPVLDSGTQVPQDLYKMEIGVSYFHQLEDKKIWGLRTSIGYDGDKPFQAAGDLTYSLSANYGFPGSGRGYWLLYVFFSNNSPLGDYIPIPGFSYVYKSETFVGSFGLPILALQWKPYPLWYYSLMVLGPIIQTELGYGNLDNAQVFVGFYWTRLQYILSDRVNPTDRLTLEEKKVCIGLRAPVYRTFTAEIQAGQAFDRYFYIGDHLFDTNGGEALIKPDWYASVSLKVRL